MFVNGTRILRDPNGNPLSTDDGTTQLAQLTDALGSPRANVNSAGATVGSTDFDAYGVMRSQTGMATPLGYTGGLADASGAAVDLNAREYLPGTGQWLQLDTYEVGGPGTGGYDRYSYTADNPINLVDPAGHFSLADTAVGQWVSDQIDKIQSTAVYGALRLLVQRAYLTVARFSAAVTMGGAAAAALDCGAQAVVTADYNVVDTGVCLGTAALESGASRTRTPGPVRSMLRSCSLMPHAAPIWSVGSSVARTAFSFVQPRGERVSAPRKRSSRCAHAGSTARPRRPASSHEQRRRTAVSASLASFTRWKWSTDTCACGSSGCSAARRRRARRRHPTRRWCRGR